MITKLRKGFQLKLFMSLIRALFPKWSFFDQVAYSFEIEIKVPESQTWEVISFYQKRRPFSLFINSEMNLALAQVNVIEHFAKDIQNLQVINTTIDSKDVHELTTFKMLKSILKLKLSEYSYKPSTIQFKIVACSPQERLDVYISNWINLGAT